MKEDIGVADEMALLVLGSRDRARAARVIAREARQNALICSLWWLEVIDCNKRHAGRHGHCRQNGVVGFGIAPAQLA